VTISRELLTKLQAQNSYNPLIFSLGITFNNFCQGFKDVYGTYIEDLGRKLDILEDAQENQDFLEYILMLQSTSPFPEISLDELMRLPCEHLFRYESLLADIAHELVRAILLVLPNEWQLKPLSSKPHYQKLWTFTAEIQVKKFTLKEISARHSRVVSNTKPSPAAAQEKVMKRKKAQQQGGELLEINEDVESKDVPKDFLEEKYDKAHKTKFLLIRSTTATIDELTGRKRVSSVRPVSRMDKPPQVLSNNIPPNSASRPTEISQPKTQSNHLTGSVENNAPTMGVLQPTYSLRL
jgi:hypothetical protein